MKKAIKVRDNRNPTQLKSIKEKVLAYQDWMLKIKAYIDKPDPHKKPRLNPEKQYLQFYIDKKALLRIAKFCTLKDFDAIGVFFGVDADHAHKVTACFLGVDKDRNILPGHCNGILDSRGAIIDAGNLPGEENWPPPPESETKKQPAHKRNCFTLASDPKNVEAYFKPRPLVKPAGRKKK